MALGEENRGLMNRKEKQKAFTTVRTKKAICRGETDSVKRKKRRALGGEGNPESPQRKTAAGLLSRRQNEHAPQDARQEDKSGYGKQSTDFPRIRGGRGGGENACEF